MDAVGIVRFENYGSSWSYHNNNLSDLFVYSLQTNKNDANILYAGTRHSFFRRGGPPAYSWNEKVEGMLKSWSFCISPHLPIIYSFATGVLHTSTDCGNNWNTAKTFSFRTYSADVNPSNSQEMLRGAMIPVTGFSAYIWKSINGGLNWNLVYMPEQQPCATDCHTINYAPGNPQRVYAGYGHAEPPYGGLYLARNNSSGNPPWEGLSPWNFSTHGIAIDYTDDQILYIGDHGGNYGVYKSTNAGDSWIEYNEGFPEYGPPDYTPLPKINELAIDPPSSYIYAASDIGLYRRMIGDLWWYRKGSDQINESKIGAVIVNPSETNIIYCVTEDASGIGHMYTSPNYGDIWLEIPIEWPLSGERLINDLAIEVNAPDTIYAGTSQGVYKYVDNYISGPISQNTILSGDWIVTGDLTVPGNITLTLQPGTELYSVPNFDRCESGIDNSRCEIVIHGTLNPVGTETHPIKFTSLAASPQSKDWYGIRMLNSSQASIDYAHILYGYCGLMASFAQNTNIANSLIQNNYTYGLRLSGSNISINNNTIDNNGYYGIYTIACNGSIESNDITKHTGYGIWINGSVDIISNTVSNEGFLSRSQYGIYFYNGFQNQIVSQNTIKRFGQGGILLGANNSVNINNCSITDNAYYGIKRLRGYGYDKVRDSEILEHETGIYCIDHPAGGMDLGRTPFDMGNNSIYSTGASDWLYVANLGELSEPAVIYAEYNWWGSDPPDLSKFVGPVDYDPWLSGPPFGGGPQSSGEIGLNQCSKITRITPNPISRETTIYLSITQPDNIELMIYNICGQRVKTIANRIDEPGTYKVSWDGKDEQGDLLAAGVYFVQLKTNAGISSSCKIMLIR
jgi:photosystem II stability/assembly factor-like uncharacterized protein